MRRNTANYRWSWLSLRETGNVAASWSITVQRPIYVMRLLTGFSRNQGLQIRFRGSGLTAVLLICFGWAETIGFAGKASADDLWVEIASSRNDQSEYFGLKVTYEVDYSEVPENWAFNGFENCIDEGVRTLEIGFPTAGRSGVPYRFTHRKKNLGEPLVDGEYVTTYWEAFDGLETRYFHRTLYAETCSSTVEHSGTRMAGANKRLAVYDPVWRAILQGTQTEYQILGGKSPGEIVEDYSEVRSHDLVVAVDEDSRYGRVYRLPSEDGDTVVTPPPGVFVVQYPPVDDPQYTIDGLRAHGPVLLPTGGTFTSSRAHTSCKYKVISAELMGRQAGEWFPDWEAGTVVHDRIADDIVLKAYSTEELRQVQIIRNAACLDAVPLP